MSQSMVSLLVTATATLLCVFRVAVGQEGHEYSRGLKVIRSGGEPARLAFADEHIEPLHAVAIGIVGKGTKRHDLLQRVGADEDLEFLLPIGVQFSQANASLVVRRHRLAPARGYDIDVYQGKWTFSSIKEWLAGAAYPLVNRMGGDFPPPKYLHRNPFGVVLIVKHLDDHTDELADAFEQYAERYRDRLKFSMFTCIPSTLALCKRYGVLSNDEMLIIERPREILDRLHSNIPPPPKFRLQGVTPSRFRDFFAGYDAGSLKQYYMPSVPKPKRRTSKHGIRELTGWDFDDTVRDPASSVLVSFVSASCGGCVTFDRTYTDLARHVQNSQKRKPNPFPNLTVARINQTTNEHSERVEGSPALIYWSRGTSKFKRELKKPDSISFQTLLDFLETAMAEEEEREDIESDAMAPSARKAAKKSARKSAVVKESGEKESGSSGVTPPTQNSGKPFAHVEL